MATFKRWPGSWVWDNHSNTAHILDSLAKRGLVNIDLGTRHHGWPTYTITDAGLKEAAK